MIVFSSALDGIPDTINGTLTGGRDPTVRRDSKYTYSGMSDLLESQL